MNKEKVLGYSLIVIGFLLPAFGIALFLQLTGLRDVAYYCVPDQQPVTLGGLLISLLVIALALFFGLEGGDK